MVEPKTLRQRSFLDSSLKMDGILEILSIIQKKPMWFSEMCRASRIKFRNANVKYLKYCKDKGLVCGVDTLLKIPNGRGYSKKEKSFVVYSITIKGSMILEWLK